MSVGLVRAAQLETSHKVMTLFGEHKQSAGMLSVNVRSWICSRLVALQMQWLLSTRSISSSEVLRDKG
ncbi:uncharacterized [Tachysurus ichikawai]